MIRFLYIISIGKNNQNLSLVLKLSYYTRNAAQTQGKVLGFLSDSGEFPNFFVVFFRAAREFLPILGSSAGGLDK